MKVLICRTDRLGDVILSLPVAQAFKTQDASIQVFYLVNPYTAPILEHHPLVNGVLQVPVLKRYHGGVQGIQAWGTLVREVRKIKPDSALLLFSKPTIVTALITAGIPIRVGPDGRMYTPLFTHCVRRYTHLEPKHEAEYNLMFLPPIGFAPYFSPPQLFLTEEEKRWGERLWGSTPHPRVILHPFTGGSAKNWPLDHYLQLAHHLTGEGISVALTGTRREAEDLPVLFSNLRNFVGKLHLRELAALIHSSDLVVSGATGPMHLAAALQRPTLSFLEQGEEIRWRPLGNRSQILTHPRSLADITVEDAYRALIPFLA